VFNADHVNKLARMLRKHMGIPYRFVCITDRPDGITECETYPIWEFPNVEQSKPQNCYVRLRLFNPDVGKTFGDKILNLDLDCVILADLSPLFIDHDFRAVRGVGATLNGSMYMLKTGTNRHVWDNWDEKTSPELIHKTKHNGKRISGSDQAWMSIQMPGAATWGPEDGVHQFSNTEPQNRLNAKIVFFAGKVKPWDNDCKNKDPHLYNTYASY
jgi:lipopolysaccharide biosynthesis glycosyltransferase